MSTFSRRDNYTYLQESSNPQADNHVAFLPSTTQVVHQAYVNLLNMQKQSYDYLSQKKKQSYD